MSWTKKGLPAATQGNPSMWLIYSRETLVAICDTGVDGQTNARANAERIIACVNACQGVKNPAATPDLLRALQHCADFISGVSSTTDADKAEVLAIAREAIAKASEC